MADEEQSFEEWLAEERARLDEGFSFDPEPTATRAKPSGADQALAGLGLGAGVIGGALAPHPNPVAFQGCRAAVIVKALRAELTDDDTRLQVDRTGDSLVATILEGRSGPHRDLSPAVTVTLIEKPSALTVTVSELDQDTTRETLSSIGGTVLEAGRNVLSGRGRSGMGSVLDVADRLREGVGDLVEDIQDLGLPKRVWKIIDRVGEAAERAYLDEQAERLATEEKRQAAAHAWTHCEWCDRAYGEDEASVMACPSCGASRGAKPTFME